MYTTPNTILPVKSNRNSKIFTNDFFASGQLWHKVMRNTPHAVLDKKMSFFYTHNHYQSSLMGNVGYLYVSFVYDVDYLPQQMYLEELSLWSRWLCHLWHLQQDFLLSDGFSQCYHYGITSLEYA